MLRPQQSAFQQQSIFHRERRMLDFFIAWHRSCSTWRMHLPRRILVPTDFGAAAERALDYALALADSLGAEVHVLYVAEIPTTIPDSPWLVGTDVIGTIERAGRGALDDLAAAHPTRRARLVTHLKTGEARSEIQATARELGADLVCMGTHGRRGLRRALLGSVAEHVVRTSAVPVLTLKNAEPAAEARVARAG
jgi:nucleotide-binding universal stress UspA family protein